MSGVCCYTQCCSCFVLLFVSVPSEICYKAILILIYFCVSFCDKLETIPIPYLPYVNVGVYVWKKKEENFPLIKHQILFCKYLI